MPESLTFCQNASNRRSAGETKPVHIDVRMSNYAGIFQVDELLRPKLLHSSIAPYVEVRATISGEGGSDLGVVYSLPDKVK